MLICFQEPGGAASAVDAPATSTVPSAGDNTSAAVAAAGTRRSGSRKKNVKNPASTSHGSANHRPSHAPRAMARASAPKMKGNPEGSIGTGTGRALVSLTSPDDARPPGSNRLASRVGVLPTSAKNIFHLVFQVQLLFLQGDFFEVFGL